MLVPCGQRLVLADTREYLSAINRRPVVALLNPPQPPFELACAAEVFGMARHDVRTRHDFRVCAESPGPLTTTVGYAMLVDAGLAALREADSRWDARTAGVIEYGMTSFWSGKRIRLRGIEPDDWTAFMRFAVDEERMGDLLNPPRSAESFRVWAKEQAAAEPGGDCFRLAIEAADTGKVVGAVGSHQADPRAGCFEYGVTIGTEHRRKGYAAEAVVMLLRFMFAERRYHKCEARILAHNEASLTLHNRLGFLEEGRLRDRAFLAGRHHDLVMMGMLADEFARLHSMNEPERSPTRSA
jgi:RimJ/RimL family protein N-acetyltransferase